MSGLGLLNLSLSSAITVLLIAFKLELFVPSMLPWLSLITTAMLSLGTIRFLKLFRKFRDRI